MFWPAVGVAQAWQFGFGEVGLVAKYICEMSQTHAEWSLLCTACKFEQAVQLEDTPVPSRENVLAVVHAVHLPEDCSA